MTNVDDAVEAWTEYARTTASDRAALHGALEAARTRCDAAVKNQFRFGYRQEVTFPGGETIDCSEYSVFFNHRGPDSCSESRDSRKAAWMARCVKCTRNIRERVDEVNAACGGSKPGAVHFRQLDVTNADNFELLLGKTRSGKSLNYSDALRRLGLLRDAATYATFRSGNTSAAGAALRHAREVCRGAED